MGSFPFGKNKKQNSIATAKKGSSVSYEDFIKQSLPGAATYCANFTASGAQPVFLIREDDEHLNKLAEHFKVLGGSSVFLEDNVLLLPIILNVVNCRLYELWFNYYQKDEQVDYASLFTNSDEIQLVFYSAKETVFRAVIQNVYKKSFVKLLNMKNNYPPWSMNQFDNARAKIFARFSRIDDLWEHVSTVEEMLQNNDEVQGNNKSNMKVCSICDKEVGNEFIKCPGCGSGVFKVARTTFVKSKQQVMFETYGVVSAISCPRCTEMLPVGQVVLHINIGTGLTEHICWNCLKKGV
jgi:hypothetical protein